jgi:hypothetical protein
METVDGFGATKFSNGNQKCRPLLSRNLKSAERVQPCVTLHFRPPCFGNARSREPGLALQSPRHLHPVGSAAGLAGHSNDAKNV